VVAAFALLFIFTGAPILGANLGGALAVAPAVIMAIAARKGWRPSIKGVAVVFLFTVLVIGLLFVIDGLRSGSSQSHMGRAADLATGGDLLGILLVLQRKLALNLMLFSNSLWSRLLILSIVSSAVLMHWGRRRFGGVLLSVEQSAAAMGCCVGIVGAFVFNDSGVVAAATCGVFLWVLLALRVLDLARAQKGRGSEAPTPGQDI